jgi:PTS system nitrogen regulatory IIA component
LATQARANLRSGLDKKALAKRFFDARLISFLDFDSRDEVIDALIGLLDGQGKLPDRQAFHQAIYQREELVSTGIGGGVAFPHAKMGGLVDFFVAVGIQKKKGVEWNALDKAPVRIVFLIGGPDNQQSVYLQILSMITSAVKDPELRKKLLKTNRVEEVSQLFSDCF